MPPLPRSRSTGSCAPSPRRARRVSTIAACTVSVTRCSWQWRRWTTRVCCALRSAVDEVAVRTRTIVMTRGTIPRSVEPPHRAWVDILARSSSRRLSRLGVCLRRSALQRGHSHRLHCLANRRRSRCHNKLCHSSSCRRRRRCRCSISIKGSRSQSDARRRSSLRHGQDSTVPRPPVSHSLRQRQRPSFTRRVPLPSTIEP